MARLDGKGKFAAPGSVRYRAHLEQKLARDREFNRKLLNAFPGAAAAYSLRDLTGDRLAPVVRVRRSSDNAEKDFAAVDVADGSLVAWVGAGNDGLVPVWYDQSGNGNDAAQTAATGQPRIVRSGALIIDGGLEYSSSRDDVLIAPNDASFRQQNFTLEAWIYNNSLTGFDGGIAFGNIFGGAGKFSYSMNFGDNNTPGRVGARLSDGVDVHFANADNVIEEKKWTHWAISYDGSALKTYKNSTEISSLSVETTVDYSVFADNFYIGNRGLPELTDFPLDGKIKDVRFWGRVLSPSELQSIVAHGA